MAEAFAVLESQQVSRVMLLKNICLTEFKVLLFPKNLKSVLPLVLFWNASLRVNLWLGRLVASQCGWFTVWVYGEDLKAVLVCDLILVDRWEFVDVSFSLVVVQWRCIFCLEPFIVPLTELLILFVVFLYGVKLFWSCLDVILTHPYLAGRTLSFVFCICLTSKC